jgi:hypothetical protein
LQTGVGLMANRALYMEVTKDKFELPVAVADSPYELAKMRHVTVYPILQAINPAYRKSGKSKYKKVWIFWKDEDGQ